MLLILIPVKLLIEQGQVLTEEHFELFKIQNLISTLFHHLDMYCNQLLPLTLTKIDVIRKMMHLKKYMQKLWPGDSSSIKEIQRTS